VSTDKRLEIEVKIRIAARLLCREKLLALGAELSQPRILERNLVFDTPGRALKEQGVLLRLRRAGERSILTMKSPTGRASAYKIREETETLVSDFSAMEKILSGIGFLPVFIYEKFRETFSLGGVLIMLDETPIGDFIEIEGDPGAIDDMASRLGFSQKDYITDSYHRLFLLCGGSGDMVFAP
jgi:adenylate cyclase, class 2